MSLKLVMSTMAAALVLCVVHAGEAAPKPAPAAPPAPPLYSRAGGVAQLAPLAEDFADKLVADETLNANARVKEALSKSSKAALRFHITSLLCQIAGGPERYSGVGVLDLYNELKISDKELSAIHSALQKSLEKNKVPADQQKEWNEQSDGLVKAVLSAKANEPAEYVNKDKGFAISFPKSWERKENTAGASVVAFSPADGENDSFREHAAVVVEDLPIEVTPEEYLKANVLASKHLVDMKILDTAPITLGQFSGQRMIYTHKLGNQELRVIALFFVTKKRGYAINCIAAADQAQKFASAFESICRTFKLLDAPAAAAPPPALPAPTPPLAPPAPAPAPK
jgi:hemoglobin